MHLEPRWPGFAVCAPSLCWGCLRVPRLGRRRGERGLLLGVPSPHPSAPLIPHMSPAQPRQES